MKPTAAYSRSLTIAVVGFLGTTALIAVTVLFVGAGWAEVDFGQRLLGFIFGALLMIIGNQIPKLRPYSYATGNPETAKMERFTGAMTVLTGAVFFVIFGFASVQNDRHWAAISGVAAITLIMARWALHLRAIWRASLVMAEHTADMEDAQGRRKIARSVVFASAILLITACLKWVHDGRPATPQSAYWVFVALALPYAFACGLFEGRHLARRDTPNTDAE